MTIDTGFTGLDHCLICVNDLEDARLTYQKLGFTITPRGRHIGWGTANYCIMFEDGPHYDYLEILGIVDPTQFVAGIDKFLETREGLIKVVFKSGDIQQTYRHLESQSFTLDEVKDLARALELPEGDVMPRFSLLHFNEDETPGLSTFTCQHLTPEMVWQAPWCQHANGAKRIKGYYVLHDDPKSLTETYARLTGIKPSYNEQTHSLTIVSDETSKDAITFIKPETISTHFVGLDWQGQSDNGTIIGLDIETGDLSACGEYLKGQKITGLNITDQTCLIPPQQACGVAIQFIA